VPIVPARALVSSIPKCGKNLIVSFFDALELVRQADEQAVVTTAAYVQARWLLDTRSRGSQDQPGIALAAIAAFMAEARPAYEALVGSFARQADGTYIHGHFGYDPGLHAAARAAGLPIVFVYRDPRGALASLAHFLVERGEPADLLPRLARRDVPTALRFLLDGDAETLPFARLLAPYEGWLGAEGVLALRFEDLVGPRGGGSAGRQLAALTALADHVGWRGPASALLDAVDRAFNPEAGTFRRGRIDGWRDDIDAETFAQYPAALVDLPRAWGYADTPPPADASATEAALLAALDTLRAEQAEHERVHAAERGHAERLAALTAAYDALTADNDQRLVLVRELEARLTEVTTAYDALAADNDQRLALVREFEARLAALTGAYDTLAVDNDQRLALIQDLTARLTALAADGDERLALIQDLGSRLAALQAIHRALEVRYTGREAHLRALEARLDALTLEHEALTRAHDTLQAAYDALTADHAASRAAPE
jgi:two-component sensor histidine kinase